MKKNANANFGWIQSAKMAEVFAKATAVFAKATAVFLLAIGLTALYSIGLFAGETDNALARQAKSTDAPNIVFLMSDDQTTYSLGCYGNPEAKTPNIDALAKRGVLFENHYDTTAICMGSRANVMTGMYEYKNGCNFSHGPLLRKHWEKSYPMLLRKAGYRVAIAGKVGFEVAEKVGAKASLPVDDFDAWGGGPGQTSYDTRKNKSMAKYAAKFPHSTRSYGAFGRDFIEASAKSDKPFCLSISFKAPHRPVQPDPMFDKIYRGKKFTKPENYGREKGEHFSKQSRRGRQYPRFREWGYDKDYDNVMAKYHQQVYAIDVAVGMIQKALVDNGVDQNTVVIYTSDNGFFCGSHGYGSKVLPYEESSRVPLIICDPRISQTRGQRTEGLSGNIDFAPTILKLAGVEIPKNVDGVDLMPLCKDPKSDVREDLALINVWGPAETHSLSIVTKQWKYILWNYSGKGLVPTEELYNTEKDPLELKNLAIDEGSQESLAKMRSIYDLELTHWKESAVKYHGYQKFARFFQRAPNSNSAK